MANPPSAAPGEKPFWLARTTRTIFFFAVVLTLAGIYLALQVPIAVFPQTDFPRVVIGVDNGVMPVEQMQVTITKPIEDAVNSVPGLETVRSTTSRGSAEVSLFFNWHEDMYRELQLVDAALSKVEQTLPPTVRITTNRLTFATFPILGYSLTSSTVSQTRLWEIATYDLKPPLNRVSGVSTVVVQGGQVPEFHVTPNLAELAATGVTVTDLVNAIQASNIVDSPGLYEANHELILGLVGAQVHNAAELSQLVVKTTPGGAPVRVADVATVERATMPVYTTVTANGKSAVLINIARQPTSNTVAVADGVAAKVAQLRSKLPPGVTLKPFYDQSQLVRDAIASVRDAILLGLILACIILFLFLRDWSSSLIAGLVIPVTVSVTILVLWGIGQSFNLMTLGGLAAAIGLVIDDAIVVVENIVLHRDSGEDRVTAVRNALAEITTPLVGSTITPVVVFLPLVAVTGVTGSFFRALAITMTAALLTSLALALTWTPGLSLTFLRKHGGGTSHQDHSAGRFLSRVLHLHRRALDWSLAKPLWLGVACLLLVVATWAGYKSLGSNLLPEMDEGGFVLDYIMPAGSSLAETNRVLDHVYRILHAVPEVESTSRRTGLQMGLAAVTEANTGDFTIKLKSHRHRSVWQIMSDVRRRVKTTEPELDIEVTQLLQDNINDLSNAPEPIQIKLFSPDPALLNQLGPEVGDAISNVPGVVDVQNGIDNTISGPATTFQVDPVVAARMGFTPTEVAEDATSILDGLPANNPLIANGRPYTIRVRLSADHRTSLDAIQNTVFSSASGHTATLGSLATIRQLPPQNEILSENLQRLVVVTGGLEGSDLGGTMTRVR
ncbi:MAG TPA: efflux RND transporter permease subunit, partial [Terracidiphilus sp.]|nr:efflux RND transporter permease subunit [Terracidiphilus sp.]